MGIQEPQKSINLSVASDCGDGCGEMSFFGWQIQEILYFPAKEFASFLHTLIVSGDDFPCIFAHNKVGTVVLNT